MNAPIAVVKKKNERSAAQNSPSEVRVAYPFFHEKRTKNAAGVPFTKKDGTPHPRYNATYMFPKLSSDPYQCANYMFLWALAVEAAKKMWPQNVDQTGNWVWPAGAILAVKDGDVPYVTKQKPGQPIPTAEETAKKNAWRRGYWIVEADNFLDPGPKVAKIVNGLPTDLPAKTINGIVQYKSGDFGYVNIHAWAYENETFGVNYGSDGFCFTREGELIGNNSGPKSATQMFGGVAGAVAPIPGVGGPVAPPSPSPLPPAAPVAPVAPPSPPNIPAAPSIAPPSSPPGMPPMPPAAPGGAPTLPPIPGR